MRLRFSAINWGQATVRGQHTMDADIRIKLAVDADVNDSDKALRDKAGAQVDFVLRIIGEHTAERLWDRLSASLRKLDISKVAFVNEAGTDMVQNTPADGRTDVENSIFEQLKMQRTDK